jgi:hypothetical protein
MLLSLMDLEVLQRSGKEPTHALSSGLLLFLTIFDVLAIFRKKNSMSRMLWPGNMDTHSAYKRLDGEPD